MYLVYPLLPPPKKKFITIVSISPSYYSRHKRHRRQWLCKTLGVGVNKVHYGPYENRELLIT